ncbi:SIMPL domain-containing protein [Actinotalea sp. M2MS4P-6]|uniref:SIMPL domain-containing protein n=1 Tax=Actinotalea sp. M2MS4P-6 TaxID=2983762 RepID=UPI0021E46242|nr:SIMPL domain-containing protein [Actinotalea sp. M2MS4P-6]MCV2395804.1 SIMPL domain-containing protein [Actinotalea sp. M2MS4P-6]
MGDPGFRRGGGITTVGSGRVPVVPDVAVVRLAAQASDTSARAAHEAAVEAAEALLVALRAAGVADRDLRTAATHAWTDPGATVQEGEQTATRLPRTTVTIAVEARLRELVRAGEVIGAALEAAGDAARLEGTTLQVSDQSAARGQARELAFADAVAAARQLAALAGRELGRVIDVRESGSGDVAPVAGRMAMRAAAAVPVEAGEQEVVVEVVVRHGWADVDDAPRTSG